MACLNENLIVAFFAPARSPEITAEVDAHTAECVACRRLLAEYAQLAAADDAAATLVGSMTPSAAAVPSLTPSTPDQRRDVVDERALLVQRLAQAQAKSHIGTVLKGKWEIERLLGAGGMGFVFSAKHRNGRRVAIKTMRPELALEPSLVERFLREGYIANKIEHPGAVAILDDDVMDDGTPFLVMELLVGESLRERLVRGPLPLEASLHVIAEVLDILAVAHEKGIVHRDLKPDNLFQTEDGTIKVLDFGIARVREHTRPELDTRSGTTMGTVGYMPPEQARGLVAEIDARTDVWAIGATLYSLLTGKSLHEAATTNEALLLAMTASVPPMRELLPWLPRRVQELLDRSLAFAKDARFPSARAMKDALEAAHVGVSSHAVVAPAQPAARRSRARIAMALGLVGALSIGGYAVSRSSPAPVGAAAAPSAVEPPPIILPSAAPSASAPAAAAASVAAPPAAAASVAPPPPSAPTARPRPAKPRPVAPDQPAQPDARDPLGPRH